MQPLRSCSPSASGRKIKDVDKSLDEDVDSDIES
jgi:hypothetical protein